MWSSLLHLNLAIQNVTSAKEKPCPAQTVSNFVPNEKKNCFSSGCSPSPHEDEVRELEDESECMYSAILASEKSAKLDFAKKVGSTRETLYALPGAFFLFHGKQIHGGSSYSQSNLRLHFYLFKSEAVRNGIIG